MTKPPLLAYWLRWIARGIVVLWAVFWLWFDIASSFHWYAKGGIGEAMIHIVRPFIYLGVIALCWWLELAGGLVLIALSLGAFYLWGYQHDELNTPVILVFCLPMLLAGLLLIGAWSLIRKARSES